MNVVVKPFAVLSFIGKPAARADIAAAEFQKGGGGGVPKLRSLQKRALKHLSADLPISEF